MNRPIMTIACAVLFTACLSAVATAGIPWVGQIVCNAVAEASVFMRPDGGGAALDEARLAGGGATDATVHVQLVDPNWVPVQYFPGEDIWLQFAVEPGTARGCANSPSFPGGSFRADHATDADGWTEWLLPLRGGGWSAGPVTVYLNGMPAQDPDQYVHPPLDLRTNSPDLNGDLVVNLSDIVYFTQDLTGAYQYRSDYDWDGVVNLTDVVYFAQGIGVECP